MKADTFDHNLGPDKLLLARDRNPPADRDFVIFFTPRSGSSWLTDICERTRRLSRPDECFNPQFMPEMTRALGARNMNEYVELLRRRRNTRGIYGCQLTYHQLNVTFSSEDEFMDYFGRSQFIWLIRKDIVSQAISLAKMVSTSVSHAPSASVDDIRKSDLDFAYDRSKIKHWLNHILAAEIKTESLFKKYRLKPLRLSYEGVTSLGAQGAVNLVAAHVAADLGEVSDLDTKHRKIGTEVNDHYSDKFRSEEADFLEQIRQIRLETVENCEK